MDYIKPIEEFLNEGKQVGVVYHYTSFNNLIGILETDELRGSLFNDKDFIFDIEEISDYPIDKDFIDKSELDKLYNYYKNSKDKFLNFYNISLTRNKSFHNWTSNSMDKHCRIKLDGDKLSNNFEIVPYQHLANYSKLIKGVRDEDEETLIIKKGNSIKNIRDYIISIDFPLRTNFGNKSILLYIDDSKVFIDYISNKCDMKNLITSDEILRNKNGFRSYTFPNEYIDILKENEEKISNILGVKFIFPNP